MKCTLFYALHCPEQNTPILNYVNFLYKNVYAEKTENKLNLKINLLHFLYFINEGENLRNFNLDLGTKFVKPYHEGLIASIWIKSDITI